MSQSSRLEVAWAAGFFDGEGSTSCHARGAYRSLQMSVSQVERSPLERFRQALGRRGTISQPRRTKCQPISQWRAYSAEANAAIELLYPYLCLPKQEQAISALTNYYFRYTRIANYRIGGVCRAGHSLLTADSFYIAPDGSKECGKCRASRRAGIRLPNIQRLNCDWIAIREYVPTHIRTAHQAVAWTFGKTPKTYMPLVES